MLNPSINYFKHLFDEANVSCKILLDFEYFSLSDFDDYDEDVCYTLNFLRHIQQHFSAHDIINFYLLPYFGTKEQNGYTLIFELSRFLWHSIHEFEVFKEDLYNELTL